jgi:hypothetical protein
MQVNAELDDDWQLIRDYVEHRSQSAFAAIVRRHLDLSADGQHLLPTPDDNTVRLLKIQPHN